MDIRFLNIPDVKLIRPKRFGDEREYFSETWSDGLFREVIANVSPVQDNQAASAWKGTPRGLHLQKPPFAQRKLARVVRGSILDVVVDIRNGSPSYRQDVAVRLHAVEGAQLWVSPGFRPAFVRSKTKPRSSTKSLPITAPSYFEFKG